MQMNIFCQIEIGRKIAPNLEPNLMLKSEKIANAHHFQMNLFTTEREYPFMNASNSQ